MEKIFEIASLRKTYGNNEVLAGIDLKIPYGEIVGILGSNGAGKTTFFDCITGLISNDEKIEFLPDKNKFSYMTKADIFANFETIGSALETYTALFPDFDEKSAKKMFAAWNFSLKKRISEFSLGQKNLIDFIFAISRDTEMYLLDEPMSNTDVSTRDFIRKKIIEKSAENNIFLISTHDIEDFSSLFSSICILKDGKLMPPVSTEDVRRTGISVSEYFDNYLKKGESI